MGPAFRKNLRPGLLAALLGLLGACAPTRPAPQEPLTDGAPTEPVEMRIIYVIHGDGDYSYHDSAGNKLLADREAVRQARDVGRRAKNAEVFIFDQKPMRQAFFDMTQKAGNYFHYNAGIMQHRNSFTRTEGDPYLKAESDLLHRDAVPAEVYTVLVYFGHEIPLAVRKGYSTSDADREFSLADFTQGLAGLGDSLREFPKKPFDLVVLSSCYGGTPLTIKALTPLTQKTVASPAYLHLSFLDTRSLADTTIPAHRLADSIAAQSFEHLKTATQTEITVGIYDADSLGMFLGSKLFQSQIMRSQTAGTRKGKPQGTWKDCGNDPSFDARTAGRGVKLYYQPPRFGPLKNTATRSAWQCLF